MSITNIPLTYTKDELLDALAAVRKRAEKVDAKNLAAHRKAEERYLIEFRKACREALRWDYETLKKNGTHIRPGGNRYSPSCPRSRVSEIDSLVAMVQKLHQPRFTLSANGKWGRIYDVLTADVPQIKGLC